MFEISWIFFILKEVWFFSVFPWMLLLLMAIGRIIKDVKHLSFWDLVYKKEKILNSSIKYGCVRHLRLSLLSVLEQSDYSTVHLIVSGHRRWLKIIILFKCPLLSTDFIKHHNSIYHTQMCLIP